MHPLPTKITLPLLIASIAITVYWTYSLIVNAYGALVSVLGLFTGILLVISFWAVTRARREWEKSQKAL